MPPKKWPFVVIGILAVMAAAIRMQQEQIVASLRGDIKLLRGQHSEWTRLRADNRRLRAAQISTEEMGKLRGDRAAVARLRGAIKALEIQAKEPAGVSAAKSAVAPKLSTPSITEDSLPVSLWINAGSATPTATLETVMWAAAGGDVDLIARNLVFDPEARAQAQALLVSLPAAMRTQYKSPEQLIAFLTAKDVPLGSAKITDLKTPQNGDVLLAARLRDPAGKYHNALFYVRQEGADWKLVVRPSVIEKYAVLLAKPIAVVPGK